MRERKMRFISRLLSTKLSIVMLVTSLFVFAVAQAQMAASTSVPKYTLIDGREIPALALGTYLGFDKNGVIKPKNNELRDAILRAFDLGYRHIDTAIIYGTEYEIGQAIGMKVGSGEMKRDDIYITTKLWNTHHKREQVVEALRESLKNLGTNYVDLYLMHWPLGLKDDHSYSDVDYMETWRGMEDAVKLGLVKSIGVSNFNKEQLKRVIDDSTIKPVALQIEIHPEMVQTDLAEFAQSNGLVVMGYSPLGTLVQRFGLENPGLKFDDPVLSEIADKHKKTVPQIVLRWLVERGIVPVVKSTSPKRQSENINIFDFTLTRTEVKRISDFNSNVRLVLPSFWQSHPFYPFDKVDNPAADPFST